MSSDRSSRPCEDLEEQLIKAAFTEILSQEYEELQSQPLTTEESTLPDLERTQRAVKLKMIERAIKRRDAGNRARMLVRRTLSTAAMLLAVVTIGIGTGCAFSETFCAKIVDLLAVVRPEYSRFSVKNGYEPATVPEGWVAGYYPLCLPAGYTLITSTSTRKHSLAVFSNAENANILFQVSTHDLATQMDTENATCSTIQISNEHAYLFDTGDAIIIIWAADSRYFSVSSSSVDTSLDFIKMIHPIRED